MLGKLFKYEFKNTAKVMLTIYGVLLAVTALGMLVFSFDPIRNGESIAASIILVSYILLYVLSILALYIVTYVYLTIHFHKTMYSVQGYLTHTLPVKPLTTFHVKLATALVWMITCTLLMILSIVGFISAIRGPEFWHDLSSINIDALNQELLSELGMPLSEFIFMIIFFLFVNALASLLIVYASSSIGQLFNQHKIVASVIAGIIFYFAQQIVALIVSIAVMVGMINDMEATAVSISVSTGYNGMIGYSIGISFLFIIVYYIICNIVVRKKINLE